MNSRKNIGIVVALLGLLMTCCLCPVVVNDLVFIGSSGRTSLYFRAFPTLINRLTMATYISGSQLLCTVVMALIVLIIGIVVLVQAKGNGQAEQPGGDVPTT